MLEIYPVIRMLLRNRSQSFTETTHLYGQIHSQSTGQVRGISRIASSCNSVIIIYWRMTQADHEKIALGIHEHTLPNRYHL